MCVLRLQIWIQGILLIAVSLFGLQNKACGDVILTASGANTFTTNEFFQFEAPDLPGGLTITGLSIDLQGGTDTDDFWDADQNGGNSPWGFRNGTGIASGDVTFNQAPGSAPPHSSILNITFAAGTMAEGDSFTFDFDTDFTITDGDEFSQFGVTAQLTLSDGSIYNTTFVDDGISNDTSLATFAFAVPEPTHGTVLALVVGLAASRRKRRR